MKLLIQKKCPNCGNTKAKVVEDGYKHCEVCHLVRPPQIPDEIAIVRDMVTMWMLPYGKIKKLPLDQMGKIT